MNTLKKLAFSSIIGLGLVMSSCQIDQVCTKGSGPTVIDTLAVGSFTGINLALSGDVYISKGPVQSVVVHGQENLIEKLKTDVEGGVWKIDFEGCTINNDDFEVHITLPELDFVKISGSGNIISEDTFATTLMGVVINGSGDITLATDAGQMDSEINGSGNLFLSGIADTHSTKILGSGNIKAFDLATDETLVTINGSGDAEVSANQLLDVKIGGSGDVLYKGSPQLNVKINGSGTVVNAN
ncbi:MAG: head GIN domain-containing protein [Bacteroidia bacterium]|nr:head GIN domain-containing protein [Bacteroidia bacterium]